MDNKSGGRVSVPTDPVIYIIKNKEKRPRIAQLSLRGVAPCWCKAAAKRRAPRGAAHKKKKWVRFTGKGGKWTAELSGLARYLWRLR